ncbi:conserved hypothetical protein [Ricinus communis]|uniref:Uncharacterized protein n=1 Tax=Ricinus communis TaxID=3988 RepID=B9RPW3_RICCO|nr:conserved hypothetical protein [Ricinus communis]
MVLPTSSMHYNMNARDRVQLSNIVGVSYDVSWSNRQYCRCTIVVGAHHQHQGLRGGDRLSLILGHLPRFKPRNDAASLTLYYFKDSNYRDSSKVDYFTYLLPIRVHEHRLLRIGSPYSTGSYLFLER